MRSTRLREVAALLAVLGLFLVACGRDDDASTASDSAEELPAEDGAFEADVAAQGGEDGADPLEGRKIITTAFVDVVVEDVPAAAKQVVDLATERGGFVSNEETTLGTNQRSTITLRLPPGDLRSTLDEIGAVGEIHRQSITTDDVTETVVDLESRELTAAASVERLRGFLAEAESVTDIAALESELVDREAELETLRGQLRTLEGQIELSTLTVSLSSEEPIVDEDDPTFVGAVKGGWGALVATGYAIALIFGGLLVWLPFIALAIFGIRKWNRWYANRPRKPKPQMGPTPPPPPPPAPPPSPAEAD